jgi:hypothetical protein
MILITIIKNAPSVTVTHHTRKKLNAVKKNAGVALEKIQFAEDVMLEQGGKRDPCS